MEIIKKIINRREFSGNDIHFKVNILQTMDNLGILSDISHESDTNFDINAYIKSGGQIIGATNSRLSELKSYDALEPYKVSFDMKKKGYKDFKGDDIIGVDRVVSIDGDEVKYVFNAVNNIKLGTLEQSTGILYTDNPISGVIIPNELTSTDSNTEVQFMSEGWNETNISISPQIQEEYLLGIINTPEVKTDVFIDRGVTSVLDNHLRLSEIETLDHLTRYGNGFYKINRK